MVEAYHNSETANTSLSSVTRAADVGRFRDGRANARLRLLIVWACIALIAVFAISTVLAGRETLQLTCLPMVPREGLPTLLHLALRNLSRSEEDYAFRIYVNGEVVVEGKMFIPARSSRDIRYIAPADIPVGQSLKIYAQAQTVGGSVRYEKHLEIPPCPPEIWSSFSSLASFSTSQRVYITSFSYYKSFAAEATIFSAVNSGVVVTISLLVVLVFLQVSDPSWRRLGARTLSMRARYGWLAAALLAIFGCMIFTKVVLIISGVG